MNVALRRIILAAVAVVGVGLSAGTAHAGGWAVSILDGPPEGRAGEETEVGFTILQHGQTPADVDAVSVEVTGADGSTAMYAAHQEGPVGHYVASVRMPAEGTYRWRVNQGLFGPYELNPLKVGGLGPAGGGAEWVPPLTVAGASVVVLAVAAVASVGIGGRRRPHAAA